MKKLLTFVFAVLFLGMAYAEDEVFPIMSWGWVGWAGEKAKTVELYQEMKECGISVAGFVNTDEQLEAISKAGLKAFWCDWKAMSSRDFSKPDVEQWRKDILPVVEKYNSNPAVIGYYVQDEPNGVVMDGALKMASLMEELAGEKLVYLNLYSNSTEQWRLDPFNYYDYVEKFYASPLKFSGFDQYVFYHDKHMRHTFYESMKIHRELALKYGKQWWYCALSVAHRYYAEPTFTQLAHQVYSALAYGARGLSWFTYLPTCNIGWYASPIDDFMNRTHTWYDLRFINNSVQNMAYVLNHLKSDRVYHFGSTVPETDERINGPDEGSLITGMKNSNNWLVGEFTHEQTGERWLIIVNKNLEAPVECNPIWREGKKPKAIKAHSISRKNEIPFNREPNDSNIIQPGVGVLLHLYY